MRIYCNLYLKSRANDSPQNASLRDTRSSKTFIQLKQSKRGQFSSLVDDVRFLSRAGGLLVGAAVSLSDEAAASTSGLLMITGACSRGSSFVCFLLFLCYT
jgi:hypothetical protein